MNYSNHLNDKSLFTLNATRICRKDAVDLAIEIFRTGFNHTKPNNVLIFYNKVFVKI